MVLGLDRSGAVTLAELVQGMDGQRLARYRDYLAFYEGAQWEGRPRPGERRLTFNYARTFVRKVTSYLFSEPIGVDVPAAGAGAEHHQRRQAAQDAIRRVYEANDLDQADQTTAVDAAVLGDGAYKVTWDAATRQPLVRPVDIQGIYAWWAPDDIRRLVRVVQAYTVRDDTPRTSQSARAAGKRVIEDWRPDQVTIEIGGQVTRSGPNHYPWIPYVIFPNEAVPQEFWGASDLIDLIPINQELNRRLSTLSGILDLSGAPIAVLENVAGSQGIEVKPGARWEIPQDAKAYLLDLLAGGGVELHIKAIDLLYRTLHDVAETPRTAFGDSGQNLSGVALEVELQPLIQKVKRKRTIWETVIRRRNAMILDLLARHGEDYGTRRTTTIWGPLTPRDEALIVTNEARLVAAGVHSRQHAAEQLGNPAPAEEFAAWLAEERAVADARRGPEPPQDDTRTTPQEEA